MRAALIAEAVFLLVGLAVIVWAIGAPPAALCAADPSASLFAEQFRECLHGDVNAEGTPYCRDGRFNANCGRMD